jgi:antitoxin HicB
MGMKELRKYPFDIRTLTDEEGGGFLISFPDFNECISDGETVEEAIENGYQALEEVIKTLEEMKMPVPEPGSYSRASGKFVLRLPKSLHAYLLNQARAERVSMNTLAVALLAEGLGRKKPKAA